MLPFLPFKCQLDVVERERFCSQVDLAIFLPLPPVTKLYNCTKFHSMNIKWYLKTTTKKLYMPIVGTVQSFCRCNTMDYLSLESYMFLLLWISLWRKTLQYNKDILFLQINVHFGSVPYYFLRVYDMPTTVSDRGNTKINDTQLWLSRTYTSVWRQRD